MKFKSSGEFITITYLPLFHPTAEGQQQGLQSLSYPEGVAVYQQRPPPPTPTTTLAPETSTKRGFFGGIRNFFGGKKEESTTESAPTPPPSTSARTTPTTARTTPRPAQQQQTVNTIAVPTGTSTTTTRRPTTKEEFPALPGQRNQNNNNQAPVVTPPSIAPAWNRPTSPTSSVPSSTARSAEPVRFVPRDPQPPSMFTTKATTAAPGTVGLVQEVKAISESLFTKDTAKLNRFVTANYQKKTASYSLDDDAPQKFLTVDEEKLNQVATVEKMKALFNNYEIDTSVNEHSTALEKNEENDFIDEMLKTNVMRTLMQYLQTKEVVTSDPKTHKDLLKTIWFTMYSRGQGRIGSSGFEHVFLAENKNNTIIGMHNWIYMYEMEKSGHVDYKGWIKKVDMGTKGTVVKLRFSYDNLNKPVNGVFIGTTPELEIALYTLCFATFPDKDCAVTSGNGNEFKIRTYTFRYRGKTVIGSAYPEVH